MRTIFVVVIVIITSFNLYADTVEFSAHEPEAPSYFDRLIDKTVGRLFEKPNVRLVQESGRIYLAGEDVEGKKKIATQLVSTYANTVSNWASIDWSKNIDVSNTIPSQILNLGINRPLPTDGVNCHSTSLYVGGLVDRLSYVNAEEFEFYIDNYCTQIAKNEPGAIGIMGHHTIFSHSFTTISNNVIFQKKSLSRDDPLRFYLIKDYKSSEFYRCEKIPREFCPGQFRELKEKVNRLDSIYQEILLLGLGKDRRDTAIHEISPLIDIINNEIQGRVQTVCTPDLIRAKLRLESLQDIAEKIKGNGYYKRDKGLFDREPKY